MTETTHIKHQFNVKLNGGGVTETTLFTLIKCHPYSGFSLIFSNKYTIVPIIWLRFRAVCAFAHFDEHNNSCVRKVWIQPRRYNHAVVSVVLLTINDSIFMLYVKNVTHFFYYTANLMDEYIVVNLFYLRRVLPFFMHSLQNTFHK